MRPRDLRHDAFWLTVLIIEVVGCIAFLWHRADDCSGHRLCAHFTVAGGER
jgi:hypothetical protein